MKRTEEYNLVSIIELPTGEAAGLGLLPAALPEALLGAHGEETVQVVFCQTGLGRGGHVGAGCRSYSSR